MDKFRGRNNWQHYTDYRAATERLFKHFRNHPIPSDEVLKIIGIEEVEKIDAKIKSKIRWKELLHGKNPEKVDYSTPMLYFTNSNFPDDIIVCKAGANMNIDKEVRFSQYKSDARSEDYTMEYKKRVIEIINYK